MSDPSRSVALPLPSSPHWAPSTTMAGMGVLPRTDSEPLSATAPGLLRRHATKVAAPRRGARSVRRTADRGAGSVPPVDDLLLITNAAAGSNERDAVDAALEVLRGATKVDVAATEEPEELDDVLAELGGRSVVVAGGDGSLHAVVNALWHLELLGATRLGL